MAGIDAKYHNGQIRIQVVLLKSGAELWGNALFDTYQLFFAEMAIICRDFK